MCACLCVYVRACRHGDSLYIMSNNASCTVCLQLVDKENVRAVISYNEEYEISYFTNSKKVSHLLAAWVCSIYMATYMCLWVVILPLHVPHPVDTCDTVATHVW